MQLTGDKPSVNFDRKKVKSILISENKFITNLFSMIAFPTRYEEGQNEPIASKPQKLPSLAGCKKSRATSIFDLANRMEKKQGSYKEKFQKKNAKTRFRKKSKQDERNAQKKLLRAEKLNNNEDIKSTVDTKPAITNSKPVFNSEGKMVFSKFDFSGLGKTKKAKKVENDPKKILQNLQKQKEKLQKLEADGETDKVIEIKEKSAWKNALAKSEGEKVKDDPELLKKSVKRHEQQQRKSKKKWDDRLAGVQNAKDERQRKRTDNIEKRKKDKKHHAIKRSVKRGKVVPGF